MECLLKLIVLWLCIDAFIVATAWYAVVLIKPCFTNRWRQVVVDEMPDFYYYQIRRQYE